MSAQPFPRTSQNPNATARPESNPRGDGARARLTVAPEAARRRLRARLMMWTAALVTAASLFTLVAFHVFAAQSAFTLERLSNDRANEQLRYERLRESVATLSSAQNVIAASKNLGMVPGPSPISLAVGSVSSLSKTPTMPAPSSNDIYDQTKQALAP